MMIYRILADIIVMIHAVFILFVVLGGVLVLKYPKVAYFHLPVAVWGAIVEFFNIICPLTLWENHFRKLGGAEQYQSDFVERYLIPLIYPSGLTVKIQFVLGIFVVIINVVIYSVVVYRYFRKKKRSNETECR